MPLKSLHRSKRIVWRYMSKWVSRTSIVCDSHWDNESFVVRIILQHRTRKRASCHNSCAVAVLLSRIIKNATRDCKFKKRKSRNGMMQKLIYIEYDEYIYAMNNFSKKLKQSFFIHQLILNKFNFSFNVL